MNGDSSSDIAQNLKDNGIIRNEDIFKAIVKISGNDGNLKAGRYNFSGRLDTFEIISILVHGFSESDDIRILISEGFNVWEIDRRLADLNLINAGEFSSRFHNEEGYLFPDTYRINRYTEANDFVYDFKQRLSDNFREKTKELLKDLTSEERKKIIIIASILEKEARLEKDMKLVAGIIYNRLEADMLLQIDATVLYGACLREAEQNNWTKNCRVELKGPALELKIDGPFNSYIRGGLPPEPISNPGLRSINAALNPTKSDYLYYLSTRDGSTMIYSKTAGEHVANRRKYLGI